MYGAPGRGISICFLINPYKRTSTIRNLPSGLFLDRLVFRIADALTNFVFYRVFCVVELADALAQTTHQFRNFIATEHQQHHQEDQRQFGSADIAKKKKSGNHSRKNFKIKKRETPAARPEPDVFWPVRPKFRGKVTSAGGQMKGRGLI